MQSMCSNGTKLQKETTTLCATELSDTKPTLEWITCKRDTVHNRIARNATAVVIPTNYYQSAIKSIDIVDCHIAQGHDMRDNSFASCSKILKMARDTSETAAVQLQPFS